MFTARVWGTGWVNAITTINYGGGHSADMVAHPNVASEPDTIAALPRLVRPGDRAIDVGANIGLLTLLMSKLVGPNGEVIAFEPDPRNMCELLANIKLNAVKNVHLRSYALWSHASLLDLHLAPCGGYSSAMITYNESVGKIQVMAPALDDVIADAEWPVRLLKVDSEGAELEILRGARKLLSCGVDFVVCEVNYYILRQLGSNDWALREYMAQFGYEYFVLRADGQIPDLIPNNVEIIPPEDVHVMMNALFSTQDKVQEAWK